MSTVRRLKPALPSKLEMSLVSGVVLNILKVITLSWMQYPSLEKRVEISLPPALARPLVELSWELNQ
jgi:hypothetical protein